MAARKRVLFNALVTTDRGASHVRCTIRDISDTGARIGIARNVELPAIVHLVDVPNQIAYEAAIVWRRAPLYGLAFIQSLPLTKSSTPLFLRRLWFESAR